MPDDIKVPTTINMPLSLREKLDAYAKQSGVSRSVAGVDLVTAGFEALGVKIIGAGPPASSSDGGE